MWIFLPERAEKWAILLHRGLAYVSEKHERKYIAGSIEERVRRWKERMLKELSVILPYDLKVKWVNMETVESELKEGKLIVKMKNHRNQSKNFAFAVREFVPNTLIPKARQYVDPLIMQGIDHVISKSILSDDTRALGYFSDQAEDRFSEHKFKQVVDELDVIHGQGQLTRILLSQYSALSILYPQSPNERVHQETLSFEKMLFNVVTKDPKQDVQLRMNGTYIQTAIVPVARTFTLLTSGIKPHLDGISGDLDQGIMRFYIIGAHDNIVHAKEVYERACSDYGMTKVWENEFKGTYRHRRDKLYCGCLEKT
jgi:hypothetical protein